MAALERLAMREAWRRGGVLRPGDLSAFLPEEEAERLLEGLAARGLCRKEGRGTGFRACSGKPRWWSWGPGWRGSPWPASFGKGAGRSWWWPRPWGRRAALPWPW